MPELPEVETIRRQLRGVLVGKVVEKVEVVSKGSWEGDMKSIKGAKVVGTRRFGKALVIDLSSQYSVISDQEKTKNRKLKTDDRLLSLVIHLKMTGQLVYDEKLQITNDKLPKNKDLSRRLVGGHPTEDFVKRLPSSHTRVIFSFKNSVISNQKRNFKTDNLLLNTEYSKLYFNDQRKFGWVKLMKTEEVERLKFIQGLGKEPWDLSDEEWGEIFKGSKKSVKVRIMDQDQVAGVGNIYANDACWEAKIDPRRESRKLGNSEARNLLEALKNVLDEGIKYGGATASNYVDLHGLGGKYQEHFRVYQREGEKCLRCGGVIKKIRLGGRGTFWCEECQK